MLPFSPRRFAAFATELSKAITELSHERQHRIEQLEIRRRYGVRHYTQEQDMSITGLESGTFQAMLADIKKSAQARKAAGIAKIKAAHSNGLEMVDAAMNDVAKKIDREVDSVLREFAESTNGPEIEEPEKPVEKLAAVNVTPLPVVDLVKTEAGQTIVLPAVDAPFNVQSFISTPVDDTGAVDRIKLNSAQTG